MFSAVRSRIRLTPATVIAVVALVFAMTGGAYAAKRYLITSTKQISPKVLAALKGKPGAAGAPGAKGTNGTNGANGTNGTAGTDGKEGKPGEKGEKGEKGTPGTNGRDGSPWVVAGLPEGATEMGVWSLTSLPAKVGVGQLHISISFPVPLKDPLTETEVHLIGEGETGEPGKGCGGGSSENPTAEPGNLCVYIAHSFLIEPTHFALVDVENGEEGAGIGGADLVGSEVEKGAFAQGDWAVTGK